MKRFISIVCIFFVLCGMGVNPVYATQPTQYEFFDDFESYTVTESGSEFTGKGTVINENWSTSSVNAGYNDGMKVSDLYIAQVKRKCGIELAENFNIPRSEGAKQPQCPKEKEEAIIGALKAFQMI